jgi:hypothetical protein
MNEAAFIGQNSCYCAAIEPRRRWEGNQGLKTIETFDNPHEFGSGSKLRLKLSLEARGTPEASVVGSVNLRIDVNRGGSGLSGGALHNNYM